MPSGVTVSIYIIICMAEIIINDPMTSLIGGAKSNLASRIFAINIHLNYSVSLYDRNIKNACTLLISLKGIEKKPWSKVLAIQLEHCMALIQTSTFNPLESRFL